MSAAQNLKTLFAQRINCSEMLPAKANEGKMSPPMYEK